MKTDGVRLQQHTIAGLQLKKKVGHNVRKHKFLFLLMAPGFLYFILFHYLPMYGIVIAFQDYKPFDGALSMITDPHWVGFKHFTDFFHSYYFVRILKNTLVISIYKLLFGFPAPLILALLLNEVRSRKFKRTVQTISYLPHFLSWVIISGLIIVLLSPTSGLFNQLIVYWGGEPVSFLENPSFFRSILVVSDIWAGIGWGSIIYLAALAGVNPELYEGAVIDGAGRFQQMIYISIPSISNIMAILFILSVGSIMNAGFEQILMLYNPRVYDVGDIIDTYVYREGLITLRYSYATAIGLFKNMLGLLLLLITNYAVRKIGKEGIW